MSLIICTHCHRHIRDSETACPFCQTVRLPKKPWPVAAALGISFGVIVAAGCSSDETTDGKSDGGLGASDARAGDAASDVNNDANTDLELDVSITPVYGPAPLEDVDVPDVNAVPAYMPAPMGDSGR